MATNLSLSAKPSVGAVLVEITGAPDGPLTITRMDSNGTAFVRLYEGQEPIGGSLTIFDYEAALTGTITYEVMDAGSVTTSGTVSIDSPVPFINAPVLPHLTESVEAVTDYESGQDNDGTIHWIIGRSDPVVTGSPLRLRQGSLTMYASSYAEALAIRNVASPGEVLLFRQPDFLGMDTYLIPMRVGITPGERTASGRKWNVTMTYQEVLTPDDSVRSSTWNFDEVLARGTFADITAQFPTFNSLVAGP